MTGPGRRDGRALLGSRAVLLAPLVVLGLGLWGIVTVDSARLIGRTFPGFFAWDNGVVAVFHGRDWTGAGAQIPANGRIVEVDGEPFRGGAALLEAVGRMAPGTDVRYSLRTRNGLVHVTVPTMRMDRGRHLATFGIYLANALVLLLVAGIALVLRPDRSSARAVALAATTLACTLLLAIDYLVAFRFTPVYPVSEALMPGAIAYFALVFPRERIPRARRLRVLSALLLPLVALGASQSFLFHSRPELALRLNDVTYALLILTLIGTVAALAHAFSRSPSPSDRLQVGVVLAGTLAASVPPVVGISALLALGWPVSFTWVVAFLVFVAVSMLYAVLWQDAFDAERFIRIAVGYTFATSAVMIGYAGTLWAVGELFAPELTRQPAAIFGLAILFALALNPLRDRAQRGIDRAFFRSSLDTAEILREASVELGTRTSEKEIVQYVQEVLRRSLSLEWAELHIGHGPVGEAALAEPVRFRDEWLGALRCGSKLSGAPFSTAERELVQGIANQAALALRNAHSIRALREAQAQLVRTERLAAIGELAGAVAHGLRNPLAGIRAAAQLSREEAPAGPLHDSLGEVIAEVDRLETRVRSLLNFSRPFEPQQSETDVKALLEKVSRGLAPRADRQGVLVKLDLPAEALRVHFDPHQLEETLEELAANALDVTPQGGEIRISAERGQDEIVLRILDTGPGIPEGIRHRLFDLFFTTRPGGSGVGLASVRKGIEQQGGSLELEHTGPDGTAFRIVLPARC